jgi:DNA-directed RNA polymerase alpha subunit
MAPQGKRTESERQAAIEAAVRSARAMSWGAPFRDRGFSDRTIDALIAHGIDTPERLLFAPEADLKSIPGIGKASFEEIMRYRTRFIPDR